VLESLKDERMKDFDEKKDVEEVLGPITSNQFAQLVNLSKKITNYNADEADPGYERKEAEINKEGGADVVIDEEEQEEEDEEDYEIEDESDEDDEEKDEEEQEDMKADVPEEDVVIGGRSPSQKQRTPFHLTLLTVSGCRGRFPKYIPTLSQPLTRRRL